MLRGKSLKQGDLTMKQRSWNMEQLQKEIKDAAFKEKVPERRKKLWRFFFLARDTETDYEDIITEAEKIGVRNPAFEGDYVGWLDDDFEDRPQLLGNQGDKKEDKADDAEKDDTDDDKKSSSFIISLRKIEHGLKWERRASPLHNLEMLRRPEFVATSAEDARRQIKPELLKLVIEARRETRCFQFATTLMRIILPLMTGCFVDEQILQGNARAFQALHFRDLYDFTAAVFQA
jgi:hypothetical protein